LAQRFAQWRGVWGYVENVAAAIALAITDDRATGQVYNIAEAQFPTEAERIRRIGQVAGWKGEVVIASPSLMPDSWSLPYNLEQYWVVDSTRIRQELGYVEPVLLAEELSAYH
jgi:nucleoside-diphosphate-sugar epimerase